MRPGTGSVDRAQKCPRSWVRSRAFVREQLPAQRPLTRGRREFRESECVC
jgi:hypothetical protein